MEGLLWFVVAALATFRLSLLVVDDPGPFDALDRLRGYAGLEWVYDHGRDGQILAGSGEWVASNPLGEALSCFWCVSLLAGLAVAWCGRSTVEGVWIELGLAYSGIAILLRKRFKVQRY